MTALVREKGQWPFIRGGFSEFDQFPCVDRHIRGVLATPAVMRFFSSQLIPLLARYLTSSAGDALCGVYED
jgi:hypothetical protein